MLHRNTLYVLAFLLPKNFVKIKFMYVYLCVTQDFFCKLFSNISYNLLSYDLLLFL